MNELLPVIALFGILGTFLLICLHARKRLRDLSDDPPLYMKTTRPNRTFPKPLLRGIARAEKLDPTPPDDPPLRIGEECRLVRGIGDDINFGPVMTVVDASDHAVITAWDDGCQEHNFPRALVRRYKPDELVRPAKRVSA